MLTETTSNALIGLERDGIAVIPNFLTANQLQGMQTAFDARLRHVRWNEIDGYEKERFRHVIEDVLTLDQGFVDAALHPLVKETLREYVGEGYQLVEAKGWRSLPTRRNFHGWHGDAWYDQTKLNFIPREVKLAVYLTDVRTGFFEYVRESHQKHAPHPVPDRQLDDIPTSKIVQVKGPAGTGFLFDTSGIHRQTVPILEPRSAVFYNYHDPSVPLQKEDVDFYRYHPLLLNAAFLGNLSDEDCRILGFGDQRNYFHAFSRRQKYPRLQYAFQGLLDATVAWNSLRERAEARLRRVLKSARLVG
jgi:Phytanoyl-CoA dioxygenase (PhyH)